MTRLTAGPVVVIRLTAGLGALAIGLLACAALLTPRTRKTRPDTPGDPR
jgi:hypothetical protein